MKDKETELGEPLAFLVIILLLEALFIFLASTGWFWGMLLFILISSIQIITLILVWYVFRLLLGIHDRLKDLESKTIDETPDQ